MVLSDVWVPFKRGHLNLLAGEERRSFVDKSKRRVPKKWTNQRGVPLYHFVVRSLHKKKGSDVGEIERIQKQGLLDLRKHLTILGKTTGFYKDFI